MPSATISISGPGVTRQAKALRAALNDATANRGGPSARTRRIDGMSGQRYRTLVNRLISDLSAEGTPRYLEIGCWKGSTAAAAMDGNRLAITCVDNWSEFGGPKAEFLANVGRVRSPRVAFDFIESDFRAIDYRRLGAPFDVILFDGPHTERDQYDGIVLPQPALANPHILIVDDWNWPEVRKGTERALRDLSLSTDLRIEIRTTLDDTQPMRRGCKSDWHNGYLLVVLSQPN